MPPDQIVRSWIGNTGAVLLRDKIKRHLRRKDMWARVENGNLLYTPVATVHGPDHAHGYLAGKCPASRTERSSASDMRANSQKLLKPRNRHGVLRRPFDDVVRSTTYVTDIDEYYRCSDERFKFFRNRRPASVLIQVSRLGHAEAMVEIEVEASWNPKGS